ncbi:unnamed protein product [Spirodela intermedia]|uniref:Uncharacterized protein n=1 Tax=Spirodela intermedia TaxID=51605 RepID=A0A7I8K5Q8_SPIIN|nr:unnamed protein product [Spirodela intermedia]
MGRPVAGGEEAAVEVRERQRERREDVDVTALGYLSSWVCGGGGCRIKGYCGNAAEPPGEHSRLFFCGREKADQSMEDLVEEGGSGAAWTDEKHTSFLNCLEDSFVRWMMMGGRLGSGVTRPDAEPLRLDRHMPDGEDSTRDCRSRKSGSQRAVARHRHGRTDIVESHGKTRKRWHRRQADPQLQEDQVVPRYEGTTSEENGRPNPTDARLSTSADDRRSTEN